MTTTTLAKIALERVIKEYKLPIKVCEACIGEGNITTFCGHYVEEVCPKCKGKGYAKKSRQQKGSCRSIKSNEDNR